MPADRRAGAPDAPTTPDAAAIYRQRPRRRNWADLADEMPAVVRLPVWPESLEAAAAAARADPAAAVAQILQQAAPEGGTAVSSLRWVFMWSAEELRQETGGKSSWPWRAGSKGNSCMPCSTRLLAPPLACTFPATHLPSFASPVPSPSPPPQRAAVGDRSAQGCLGRVDGHAGTAQVGGWVEQRVRSGQVLSSKLAAGVACVLRPPASGCSPSTVTRSSAGRRRAVLTLLLRAAAGGVAADRSTFQRVTSGGDGELGEVDVGAGAGWADGQAGSRGAGTGKGGCATERRVWGRRRLRAPAAASKLGDVGQACPCGVCACIVLNACSIRKASQGLF